MTVVGHLHHRKTTLLEVLVKEYHKLSPHLLRHRPRFKDSHIGESEQDVSLKITPISSQIQNTRGKSHLLNLIDKPRHVNFNDEVKALLCLCDGVLVV
jgi:116 kDa U5 small nuclear ribonucleoprotein component